MILIILNTTTKKNSLLGFGQETAMWPVWKQFKHFNSSGQLRDKCPGFLQLKHTANFLSIELNVCDMWYEFVWIMWYEFVWIMWYEFVWINLVMF